MRAKGMFISQHQISFKWLGVVDYLAYRVTDGLVEDTKYRSFLPEINKAPRRIAVHNFRNHQPAQAQLKAFLDTYQGEANAISGDYEDTNTPMSRWSAEEYETFLGLLQSELGLPVVSYANASTVANHLNIYTNITNEYGLWIARLASPGADIDTAQPNLSYGGQPFTDFWSLWQFSWTGNGEQYGVESSNVCLDVFNGSVEAMDGWLVTPLPKPCDCEKIEHDITVLRNLYQELNLDLEAAEQNIKQQKAEDQAIRRMVRDEIRKLEMKVADLERKSHRHWWMRRS